MSSIAREPQTVGVSSFKYWPFCTIVILTEPRKRKLGYHDIDLTISLSHKWPIVVHVLQTLLRANLTWILNFSSWLRYRKGNNQRCSLKLVSPDAKMLTCGPPLPMPVGHTLSCLVKAVGFHVKESSEGKAWVLPKMGRHSDFQIHIQAHCFHLAAQSMVCLSPPCVHVMCMVEQGGKALYWAGQRVCHWGKVLAPSPCVGETKII